MGRRRKGEKEKGKGGGGGERGEKGVGEGGEGGGESLLIFHVSFNYHYNAKANGSWTNGELHSDSENKCTLR